MCRVRALQAIKDPRKVSVRLPALSERMASEAALVLWLVRLDCVAETLRVAT